MNREKLIRNEQIARDQNRAAGKALKRYFGRNKEIINTPIDFVCECSDMKCQQTVTVSISEYDEIHKRNDRFLVVPGHKTPHIEKSVKKTRNLEVVEKPTLSA